MSISTTDHYLQCLLLNRMCIEEQQVLSLLGYVLGTAVCIAEHSFG
jgi:hypothetical protein